MNKLKNPSLWIGIIVAILLAAGIDPSTVTTWDAVLEGLNSIVNNPYKLFLVGIAIYTTWNDASTKKLDIPFKK